jgi:outer membrane protein assembly factor BamB
LATGTPGAYNHGQSVDHDVARGERGEAVTRTLRCLLPGCLLVGVGTLAGGDWPQFRGPHGSAVSADKALPLQWGPKENIRWTADLPGRGLSNPVITRGRLFLTACSGYRERRLHVLCFDPATGKKLWERQFAATGNTMCHPKTNMAAPTPATDGQAVYALFASGDLAALDRDGNLLWYRSLVSDYPNITNQVGMAASPVLAGDTLLLPLENAGDSFAAGLDTRTGTNRWKEKRFRDINWVTPLVLAGAGGPAALFQTSTEATAYDVRTGKVRWSYRGTPLGTVPSAAQGEGLVFTPGGGGVLALRPGTDGKAEMVWKTNRLRAGYASPVYYKGRLYGLGGYDLTAECVNAADGEPVWRQRVKGPFSASPVVGAGRLYLVNEVGEATVFATGDRAKVLARNKLYEKGPADDRDRILATPALAGGCVYLRSDRRLFCIGAKEGR